MFPREVENFLMQAILTEMIRSFLMKWFSMTGVCLLLSAGCVTRMEAGRVISDFSREAGTGGWEVENDVVMGGVSRSSLVLGADGHAVFSGAVSLENNGGFASIQYFFEPIDISKYRTACFRIKGDGKRYQFIVEAETNARHYYVHELTTSTDWQTLEIPLADLYPVRRGDRLDLPNFPGQTLAQVRFLIGNGVAEPFRLEIDKIWLR